MTIWQADLYPTSSSSRPGETVWELIICDRQGNLIYEARFSQTQMSLDWLVAQWKNIDREHPDRIQVFRSQCANFFEKAGRQWGIEIETTRRTFALKKLLKQQGTSIEIEQPPPQPLPDRLWGEQWRFASLPAAEAVKEFRDRPIPILDIPEEVEPLQRGLSSSLPIPGIMIEGGRQAMILAQWVREVGPYALNYIPAEVGKSGGIILEAGLCDRWVFQTFDDAEIALAAEAYQKRLQQSQGLHFLLIQPDRFNNNFTGYWLLLNEE